jgi:hypothetical protein
MDDVNKRIIARDLEAGPLDLPPEPMTKNIGITNEMIIAHCSTGRRFFIDEIGGEYFMIPIERRLDWYAFDQRMEEGVGPEPLPDYAHPVESLWHLEFAEPEEPFV